MKATAGRPAAELMVMLLALPLNLAFLPRLQGARDKPASAGSAAQPCTSLRCRYLRRTRKSAVGLTLPRTLVVIARAKAPMPQSTSPAARPGRTCPLDYRYGAASLDEVYVKAMGVTADHVEAA